MCLFAYVCLLWVHMYHSALVEVRQQPSGAGPRPSLLKTESSCYCVNQALSVLPFSGDGPVSAFCLPAGTRWDTDVCTTESSSCVASGGHQSCIV